VILTPKTKCQRGKSVLWFRMIFCKCSNRSFKFKRSSCLFCSTMALFFGYNRSFKYRQFL